MVKILVIEDEAPLRQEVTSWLAFEGYDVLAAENGRIGLETAIAEQPDLIICDILMPQIDGHGVLLEVRADPTLQETPFIFLTAAADYESMRYGMNLGADDYLTKPFKRHDLLTALNTRLTKHARHQHDLQDRVQRLTHALEEKSAMLLLKSQLIAMFSHDFRNPLSTILSAAHLIKKFEDRMTPDKKEKHLNRIIGSSRLLTQMLEDMLIMAEIESQSLMYRPQNIATPPFFADLIDEFKTVYPTHTFAHENDVTTIIQTDPHLLRRIMTNLLSNAVKYSPRGSTVVLNVEQGLTNGIRITVEDEGVGIAEEDQVHIFDAYYRATNVKNAQGSGLGLAIVKSAVEKCGGRVQLESTLGEGTRITVDIPSNGVSG